VIVVGLIGGVASGKSLVAKMFAESGAIVLDADKLGHLALQQEGIKVQIRQQWGHSVFDHHGNVDRSKLAAIVFGDREDATEDLAKLESITHPFIKQQLAELIDQHRSAGAPLVVLDAPILIKAGWDQFCDEVLFVNADDSVRQKRALSRGWTANELRKRENSQTSMEKKRQRATRIIENNSDIDHLRMQVNTLLAQWDALSQ
jgi:dephospho-CoA kinase